MSYLASMVESQIWNIESLMENEEFALHGVDTLEGPACEEVGCFVSAYSDGENRIFVVLH